MTVRSRTYAVYAVLMLASVVASQSAAAEPRMVNATTYLRAGPGLDYRPTDEALSGRVVDALDCTGSWCRIRYGDQTGWVAEGALVPAVQREAGPDLTTCLVGREAGRRDGRDVRYCHADPGRP